MLHEVVVAIYMPFMDENVSRGRAESMSWHSREKHFQQLVTLAR